MTLSEIKKRMKKYRDFYGGDLLGVDEIDGCKSKKELAELISNHISYMENMLLDASNHIEQLRSDTGLDNI